MNRSKYTSHQIEGFAVGRLKTILSLCPNIRSYLSENDKTPFVDGSLELYPPNSSQSKGDRIGYVEVQVKGRLEPSEPRNVSRFRVSTEDLRGFKDHLGVVLFVGSMPREASHVDIYGQDALGLGLKLQYAVLNPFRIEAALSRAGRQKSIQVQLDDLPSEISRIEEVIAFAIDGRNEVVTPMEWSNLSGQSLALGGPLVTAERLAAPSSFTMERGGVRLVALDADGKRRPLRADIQVVPASFVPRKIQGPIEIGDLLLDECMIQRVSPEGTRIHLTPTLSLTVSEGDPPNVEVSLNPVDNVMKRIYDLKAYNSIVSTGLVRSDSFELQFKNEEPKIVANSGESSELERLLDVRSKMESLGVDPALVKISDLSVEALLSLNSAAAIVAGSSEVRDELRYIHRVRFRLGDGVVELLITQDSESGRWTVLNPFDPHARWRFAFTLENEGRKELISSITPYDLLSQEDFGSITNIKAEWVVPWYKRAIDGMNLLEVANNTLLRIWLAGRELFKGNGDDRLLHMAADLGAYLVKTTSGREKLFFQLNTWMVQADLYGVDDGRQDEIRRARLGLPGALTSEEIKFLSVGYAALLGDLHEAQFLVGQLSNEGLHTLQSLPLASFAAERLPGLQIIPDRDPFTRGVVGALSDQEFPSQT